MTSFNFVSKLVNWMDGLSSRIFPTCVSCSGSQSFALVSGANIELLTERRTAPQSGARVVQEWLRNIRPTYALHTLKYAAVLVLLLCLGVGNAWATEEIIYTLTPTTGTDNNYANNEDIACIDEDNDLTITWNVTGNATMTPWRIGGKSLTNEVRVIYSKTPISQNVTKVIVSHGGASSITASVTLKVYSTAEAAAAGGSTNCISSVSGGAVSANGTKTFTRPDGHDWSGRYYRFEYSCSVSGTSNKFVEFTQAAFYAEGTIATPYTVTFTKTDGTTTALTEGSVGAGVTPPSMQATCGDWEFQGWSKSQSTSPTSTTVLTTVTLSEGKYYPTANTTLYPVYTKSGGTVFSKYQLITSASGDLSGKYL